MSEPIQLGLIGCGMIVKRHVDSYREIFQRQPDLFEIVAVCDLQRERAQDIAHQIATFQNGRAPNIYTDYEPMLKSESLDAVSVATPHFQHHGPTIAALDSGLHVVVEKPFAITVKAGQAMIAAANQNNRKLACAEPLRRTVSNRTINWAINRAGLIGIPRMLFYQRARYSLGVVVGTPWRHQKILSGGGWVHDGEVHYFDFMRMVFGDVVEVSAKIRNFEPTRYLNTKDLTDPVPSDVEDTAFAIFTFQSGMIGSFVWTHAAIGRGIDIVRAYGGEGCLDNEGVCLKDGTIISMEELQKRFLDGLDKSESERLFPCGMKNASAIAFYDFFDSIRSHRKPEIAGEDALAAQAICEAVYESDALGNSVRMADVISGKLDAYQKEIDEH